MRREKLDEVFFENYNLIIKYYFNYKINKKKEIMLNYASKFTRIQWKRQMLRPSTTDKIIEIKNYIYLLKTIPILYLVSHRLIYKVSEILISGRGTTKL